MKISKTLLGVFDDYDGNDDDVDDDVNVNDDSDDDDNVNKDDFNDVY